MRQFVFAIFVLIFVVAMTVVVVFIATVITRGGLTVLHSIFANIVPGVLRVLRADPWYVVALVISVLFLWSDLQNGGYASPVRRGREVRHFNVPRRRALPPRRPNSPSTRARGPRPVQGRNSRRRGA